MSILDDYEQDTAIINYGNKKKNSFSTKIEPIFKKTRQDLMSLDDRIVNFLVSNDILLIYTANHKLIRHNVGSDETNSPIDIKDHLPIFKPDYVKLHQMFHSPSGNHSILSFSYTDGSTSPESLYYCRKMHLLFKCKGHVISAVGWNHDNELKQNKNSTSSILLGTTKGLIFETELNYKEDYKWGGLLNAQVYAEQYWKQLYDLKINEGEHETTKQYITGIEFYSLTLKTNEKLNFALVTTINTIYQFVYKSNEELNLINLFSKKSIKLETPGNLGFSKLDVFYNLNTNQPKSIGWLVEPGVYYAFIDLSKAIKEKEIIDFNKFIPYRVSKSTEKLKPLSTVITQYHTLVLFEKFLRVMCNINGQIVMEDKFLETFGKAICLTKDKLKGTIWACSEMAIYEYSINKEDRDIIDIYLQQNDFKNAKLVASNDKKKINQINAREAQYYFDKEDFLTSAQLYAQSNQSFEEVALKFMDLKDKTFLKEYLTFKLDSIDDKEFTQINLLVAWLVELFLKDLYQLRQEKIFDDEKYELIRSEFECILSNDKVKNSIKSTKKVIYDLIINQNDDKSLISFARSIEDYEYLIEYFLRLNQYKEVLNVLNDSNDVNLIYRYAPILIKNVPKELIDILIDKNRKFDYAKLLPTLISKTSDENQDIYIMKQLVRYLEYCIYKLNVKKEIIFNYLITIYGEIMPEKIDGLLDFIKENEINFDLRFTLRLCLKIDLYEACVKLYTMMELYEDAFDYAILFDLELAKKIANLPRLDDELKKKLWLKIAKKIISKNNDLQYLSKLLNECENMLNIEDILPFFPDVLTIDLFKEPICQSLKGYNSKINELRKEITEISESIEQIREDISFSKNDHCLVRLVDICSLCKMNILIREFYQFPCKHQFHVNCLEFKLTKLFDTEKLNKLTKIKQNLNDLNRQLQLSVTPNYDLLAEKEQFLNKYDELVGSECIYCSELMINTIDKPFININEDSDEEGWN